MILPGILGALAAAFDPGHIRGLGDDLQRRARANARHSDRSGTKARKRREQKRARRRNRR